LLAEQEQELDNYYDQTDDEDLFLHTNTPKRTSFTVPQQLQEQLMNNIPSETNDDFAIEEAEDAQFISNNRISAIIIDESKVLHFMLEMRRIGINIFICK
jgi:RimJ/RimL family protein N-acetyltransferase